ncbi:Uncharacterised protein [Roseburia hominis]|nr:Uncharacterised protein [Roseburia hominis]
MILVTDSFFLLFERIMVIYITREVTEEMNFIDHAISEIVNGEDLYKSFFYNKSLFEYP